MELKQVIVEPRLTTYMFNKASKAKIPLNGTFELSPICNFSCKMCYVRKSVTEVVQHDRKMVTLEQWLAIAKEARDAGMLYLLLTGGEPLLWPDFWELYKALSEMGFLLSINTNAALIDDAAIEIFREIPPTRINITLYGASDETYQKLCNSKGVFAKVDYAIKALKNAGISVKLNGSLTPDNVVDLNACILYGKKHELIYEPNTYMYPPMRRDVKMVGRNVRFTPREAAYYKLESYKLQYGENTYKNYLKSIINQCVFPEGLKENNIDCKDANMKCRAGVASFWITWDGWMTPCGMMQEPKVDIYEKSFIDAWSELVYLNKKVKLSSICSKCSNQRICHSCAAMALTETGSTSEVPGYLCEMMLELIKVAGEELEKIT